MANVPRLIRWEWFKLRRRWMPWILLIVTLAVTQATLWGFYHAYGDVGLDRASGYPGTDADGGYAIITITCADILDGSAEAKAELVSDEFREDARERIEGRRRHCPRVVEEIAAERLRHRELFVLPGGLANSLGVAHYAGVFLIMVLGASAMGVEYGWGTLRTGLAKGAGRWQFLVAKVLSLLLLGGAGLLVASLAVMVSSLIAALTLDDGGGLAGSGRWSTAAVMFGKSVYGLAPYAVLALFLTVLTASSSMGIALSLAYYFVEVIFVGTLGGLFDWSSNVTDFLLGANTAAWMTETGVVTTGGNASLVDVGDLPGQLHAFLVLTAYIVVLGGAAFWIFQRRDVAGARGE